MVASGVYGLGGVRISQAEILGEAADSYGMFDDPAGDSREEVAARFAATAKAGAEAEARKNIPETLREDGDDDPIYREWLSET